MSLFITFATTNQNILAWVTLHSSVLHHCISSVLCCKPNTHFAQGPNNDYKQTYSHSLSNLYIIPNAFLEPVNFYSTNFPSLHAHPIASSKSAANYMSFLQIEAPWPKHSTKNLEHFTYFKIKPSIYLFKASTALDWSASILVFS